MLMFLCDLYQYHALILSIADFLSLLTLYAYTVLNILGISSDVISSCVVFDNTRIEGFYTINLFVN